MQVLLLAAGRGSRLGELTKDKPKCLVSLNGCSLLDWLFASLTSAGLHDFWMVSGYRGECLDRPGVSIIPNPQWEKTSIVASLRCAAHILREGDTIVSYTDILYTPETVRRLLMAPAQISLTYDPDWYKLWSRRFPDPLEDAEQFQFNSSGILTEIGGHIDDASTVKGQYMGLLKFTPQGWQQVEEVLSTMTEEKIALLDMTTLLSIVLTRADIHVQVIAASGGWCEIDAPSDVPVGEDFVQNGLSPYLESFTISS